MNIALKEKKKQAEGLPCSHVMRLLSMYQDKELDSKTHEQVHSHLLQCPTCASELEEMEMVTFKMKRIQEIEVPYHFSDVVMGKINEKKQWLPWPSFVYASVFIIFLLASFFILQNLDHSTVIPDITDQQLQAVNMTRILEDSQDLRLMCIQDQAVSLLKSSNVKGEVPND